MQTILVTGGCGFIGAHTIVDLVENGFNVISIDNLSRASDNSLLGIEKITGKKIKNYTVNLTDKAATEAVFIANPDIVGIIHFAAYKAVGESVEKPLTYYDNNVQGTLCLLRAMQATGVRTLVFRSSATVYGDPQQLPIREDAPLTATNPYGQTKLIGETIGAFFDRQVETFRDREALVVRHQKVRWSWGELGRRVDELAAGLLALGLEQQYPQNLENRLDTASVNSSARQAMLQLVPNGSPLDFSRRSSRFGLRSHPIVGKQQHHKGVDLSANRGTEIYAPADGVVEVVRSSKSGFGNLLKIRHAFGFSTLYAHLDEFKVKSGHFVHKGELIATSGNTGLSTAPHLHYEVHFLDRALNPQSFMDWDATNFDLVFEKERSIKWDSLVSMLETKASTQLLLSSHKDVQLTATSD